MEILTDPEQIRQHIRDIYKPNHFMMDYFHINIEAVSYTHLRRRRC